MPHKVTLREIAQAVGLSVTSVSLVLNDKPNKISQEKRELIRQVARAKHYVGNQIARSLVTQHSATLGLIVPNIESRFFSSLARHIEAASRKRGYAVFIMSSDEQSENDVELVRLLLNRGVDGVIMVPSQETKPDERLIPTLETCPAPVIMVDRVVEGIACDKVRFDNYYGGYQATKHLLEAGHTRIACLINTSSYTGIERLEGYKQALADAQVSFDPNLVFETDYYIASAYASAEALLTTDATAVFASSDNIALGLIKRLYENNLRVPTDMSIVSYDNSAADALFEPALTSIDQSVAELSKEALDLLFSRIYETPAAQGEPIAMMPARDIRLQPRLVIKDSVARPRYSE